ncbi:MAG TPA: phosphatase PAP2 family protein [Caldithrix abyssi]|uniref:Phosphatase PAP2 family protein n=1 Tax=Caldithrix abyssi TaxID=187145 RepID=A0A7V5PRE3_CALAY|nr:phosphatase PAP2 family protein [Caldithrix abyssi]
MELLQSIDTWLFYFFNVTLANPFFDWFMPIITNKLTWIPLWLAAAVLLVWKGGRKGRIFLLALLAAVALTDLVTNQMLKPLVHRARPCAALENVHLLVRCIHSYSMPSSHASNFAALATMFTVYLKKYRWLFWTAALLVAYSRMAVGVHYPSDVLAGLAVGYLSAQLGVRIYRRFGASAA